MILCFRNSSIDNQIGKCNTNTTKEELKQTIKEYNIGIQSVPHNIANQMAPHSVSFIRNKSVVNRGIKNHQDGGSFLDSRLLLYFNLSPWHRNCV